MSKQEPLESYFFNDICRICLVRDVPMASIFSDQNQPTLVTQIAASASIQIYRGDGLPENICQICQTAVRNSYNLRLQAEESHKRLQKILRGEIKQECVERASFVVPSTNSLRDEPNDCEERTAFDFVKSEIEMQDDKFYPDEDSATEWEDNDLEPLSTLKPTKLPKKKKEKKPRMKKEKPPKKEKVLKETFVDCTVCQASVVRRKLKIHMMMHNGEKPHLCDTCGRSFTWKCTLVTHKRLHTGEKPFPCQFCEMHFRSSSRLSEHMTIHSGKKSYVCESCAMAFRTFGRLKRHKRIHTGEKPYKCSFCDRCFSESYNLRQHLRLHTGEKPPHACHLCKSAFVRRKALVDHLKGQHGVLPPPPPPTVNVTVNA